MHYYQFNIADYRKDTMHLTPIEHYIYRELIDWYYLDESPIPKETKQVMRRLRLVSENKQELENVLDEFFLETENGWNHERIDQEIVKFQSKRETAKANGIKGGRPRKTQKNQKGFSENQEETKSKANHKPITNNQNNNHPYPDEFESLWKSFSGDFGNKGSKREALAQWKKTKSSHPDNLLAIVNRQHQAKQAARERGDFVEPFPHVVRWLSGRRWEDDIATPDSPEKPWNATSSGIEAKAKELGLAQGTDEPFDIFRSRVEHKAREAA